MWTQCLMVLYICIYTCIYFVVGILLFLHIIQMSHREVKEKSLLSSWKIVHVFHIFFNQPFHLVFNNEITIKHSRETKGVFIFFSLNIWLCLRRHWCKRNYKEKYTDIFLSNEVHYYSHHYHGIACAKCSVLLYRLDSAEWEGVEPWLDTYTNPLQSLHSLIHWESHPRESEDLHFSEQSTDTCEQTFRPAGQAWSVSELENCCFPGWSKREPENFHTDIKIITLQFPVHCDSGVRCNRKSSPKLLEQYFGFYITPSASTQSCFPRGQRDASHRCFNAMH